MTVINVTQQQFKQAGSAQVGIEAKTKRGALSEASNMRGEAFEGINFSGASSSAESLFAGATSLKKVVANPAVMVTLKGDTPLVISKVGTNNAAATSLISQMTAIVSAPIISISSIKEAPLAAAAGSVVNGEFQLAVGENLKFVDKDKTQVNYSFKANGKDYTVTVDAAKTNEYEVKLSDDKVNLMVAGSGNKFVVELLKAAEEQGRAVRDALATSVTGMSELSDF